MSSDLSAKILHEARKQQAELRREEIDDDEGVQEVSHRARKESTSFRLSGRTLTPGAQFGKGDVSDDEEEDHEQEWDVHEDGFPEIDVAPEDVEAFEKFMPKKHTNDGAASAGGIESLFSRRTLDKKRAEVEWELCEELGDEMGDPMVKFEREMDPRLLAMYRGVRDVLKVYRSGKLPKAFKVIPKLKQWEKILFLTEPTQWTAAAMYQATRIFASNLDSKMCQRFYNLVLLPRIRDDITEFKKLNFHLYQALAKALFKPAAFFKGILLPLCESGTCTLREATIVSSVLAKCSIPPLHGAAAMLKIAEMDYSGANSIFLRVMVDKKYTLPYRVIDALANHFVRFAIDDRELPVLWHQALLTFAQRYKSDISAEQRDALLDLLKKHFHPQISPEIRRELLHANSRDVEMD